MAIQTLSERATQRAFPSGTPITVRGRPRRRRSEESWVRQSLRIRSPRRLHNSGPPRPGCSTWRPPTARPQARLSTPAWVRLPASVLSPRSVLSFSPRPRTWLRFERVGHRREITPVSFRARSKRSFYRYLSQHRARLLHQRKGATPRPPLKRWKCVCAELTNAQAHTRDNRACFLWRELPGDIPALGMLGLVVCVEGEKIA